MVLINRSSRTVAVLLLFRLLYQMRQLILGFFAEIRSRRTLWRYFLKLIKDKLRLYSTWNLAVVLTSRSSSFRLVFGDLGERGDEGRLSSLILSAPDMDSVSDDPELDCDDEKEKLRKRLFLRRLSSTVS